jgi:putative endonuclease
MAQYYCYILECIDGSLYTGLTTDPERRLHEHLAGRGGRYTRSHPPRSLGYLEALPDLRAAMQRERALKRYPRARKLALMSGNRQDPTPSDGNHREDDA